MGRIIWRNRRKEVCLQFITMRNWQNMRTLTSAAINANVLRPPKNPTQMQMMNMKPDSVRMDESRPTRRMCDQPGVVGEKES